MTNLRSKGTAPAPAFTRGSSSASLGIHPSSFSLRDIKRMSFETVVTEKTGVISVIEGIRASVILSKVIMGEYDGILHWPKLTKGGVIASRLPGKPDQNIIAVLEDNEGNLVLKKQEEAIPIINGIVPQGYSIFFIPPQKKRKK